EVAVEPPRKPSPVSQANEHELLVGAVLHLCFDGLHSRGDVGAELGQIHPTAAQIAPGSGWIPGHVSVLGIAALPPHHPLRDRRIKLTASQLRDLLTRHVHHPSPRLQTASLPTPPDIETSKTT